MRSIGELMREWEAAVDGPLRATPGFPNRAIEQLSLSLITEEYMEVLGAAEERDVVEFAHELADLVIVAYTAGLRFGFDLDAVVAEVHKANMTKVGADGKVLHREDGKILKGEGYVPPDVADVLGLRAAP